MSESVDERLSDRDFAVLLFVLTHVAQHRRIPTETEIADVRGLSTKGVAMCLSRLRARGLLANIGYHEPCPVCGSDKMRSLGHHLARKHGWRLAGPRSRADLAPAVPS